MVVGRWDVNVEAMALAVARLAHPAYAVEHRGLGHLVRGQVQPSRAPVRLALALVYLAHVLARPARAHERLSRDHGHHLLDIEHPNHAVSRPLQYYDVALAPLGPRTGSKPQRTLHGARRAKRVDGLWDHPGRPE